MRGNIYDFHTVLVITVDATAEAKRLSLALSTKDFLAMPFDTLETMLRDWNVLETRVVYQGAQAMAPKENLTS